MINLTTMLIKVKLLTIIAITQLALFSCAANNEKTEQNQQSTYSLPPFSTTSTDSIPELTSEQESALDALNMLQINTDEKNRLYSTFANINQPCYPPDTNFVISRSEFQIAMSQFLTMHCTNLTKKEREELATASVLAQEEYTVLHCNSNSSNLNYKNGLPMSGIWIMPNVLGRRDVLLEW